MKAYIIINIILLILVASIQHINWFKYHNSKDGANLERIIFITSTFLTILMCIGCYFNKIWIIIIGINGVTIIRFIVYWDTIKKIYNEIINGIKR